MSKELVLLFFIIFSGLVLAFLIYPSQQEQERRLRLGNTTMEKLNAPFNSQVNPL